MIDKRTFCPMPFVHVDISAQGSVGYCCEAEPLAEPNERLRPEEFFVSPGMQEVRTAFRSGQPPQACRGCFESESQGLISKRLRELDRLTRGEYGPFQSFDVTAANPRLRFLSYRVGNLCNLKCLMCGPDSSHLLAIERSGSSAKPVRNKLEFTTEDFPDLRVIYIGGGEPLISPEFKTLLENLIAAGRTNIDLVLNSNLTVVGPKILTLLEKFKSVYIGASMDGYRESFAYIRFPHRWNLFCENLELIRSSSRIFVGFNVTVSILNLSSVPEMISFLEECNRQAGARSMDMTFNFLEQPAEQALGLLHRSRIDYHRNRLANCGRDAGLPSSARRGLNELSHLLELLTAQTRDETLVSKLREFLRASDMTRRAAVVTSLPNLLADLYG